MDQQKSSIGSIIGTIIIIAIIILGGLYFWGKRIEETQNNQNAITASSTNQTMDEATSIRTVSSSDDLDSIQADLNATNLNNLGTEMSTSTQGM